jgi:two-component system OmpR family response regulator
MTDVVVVNWPEGQDEVKRLAHLRIPRLLFVAPAADPPETGDVLQDWVRLPSDDRDVRARLNCLRRRAAPLHDMPAVDGHGRLQFHGAWVQLSPIEERLARQLVEAGQTVVTEARLLRSGWPDGRPTSNALRVHLHRLRRRAKPLGLEIRSVRSDGWILQPAGETQSGQPDTEGTPSGS